MKKAILGYLLALICTGIYMHVAASHQAKAGLHKNLQTKQE